MNEIGFALHDVVLAIQMLTRFPVPARTSVTPERLAGAVRFYPLAGLLVGGTLAAAVWLLEAVALPSPLRASLVIAAWVTVTGAMHLDGLMDTADGLLSNRDRERALEIMKDSKVGSMAVISAIAILLVKYSGVASLEGSAAMQGLLLSAVAGRTAMAVCLGVFPYARAGGMGAFAGGVGPGRVMAACALAAAISGLVAGPAGLLLLLAVVCVACLACIRVSGFLGGLTGDVYGAVCEVSETLALILWVPASHWWRLGLWI